MGAAKFKYSDNYEMDVVVFKRVHVPARRNGHLGYTYYETHDGRFQVSSIYNRGGNTWQAVAMDGSEPFVSIFGGRRRQSKYFNGDTLEECRVEISDVYNAQDVEGAA